MEAIDLVALGIGLVAVTLVIVSFFVQADWLKRARIWLAGLVAVVLAYVLGRTVDSDKPQEVNDEQDTPPDYASDPQARVVEVERNRADAERDAAANAESGANGRLERFKDIAGRE